MVKPNFSGVYSLKASENEDNFLKAQGIGWVLRKAAKAVGAKRVLIGVYAPGSLARRGDSDGFLPP